MSHRNSSFTATEAKVVAEVAAQPPAPAPVAAPSPVRTVQLQRTGGSFGFKIVENDSKIGVHISGLTPGSVADLNGKIFVGDFIIKVNDTLVLNSTHEEVVAAIRSSSDVMTLVLATNVTDEVIKQFTSPAKVESIRTVKLVKKPGQPFGFKITSTPGIKGVSISSVVAGGAADASGQIFAGDFLLKV